MTGISSISYQQQKYSEGNKFFSFETCSKYTSVNDVKSSLLPASIQWQHVMNYSIFQDVKTYQLQQEWGHLKTYARSKTTSKTIHPIVKCTDTCWKTESLAFSFHSWNPRKFSVHLRKVEACFLERQHDESSPQNLYLQGSRFLPLTKFPDSYSFTPQKWEFWDCFSWKNSVIF